jgi:putative transposase
MSRLRRIADRDRVFFVTTNIGDGVQPLGPAERDAIVLQLSQQRAHRDFCLFGYVVMPTHLHLLLAPDQSGLAELMLRFKRSSSRKIAKGRRDCGTLWQARYFDFILRKAGDFPEKLEYIHNNPVEARLVKTATDWRWSSAAEYFAVAPRPAVQTIDRYDLPADRNTPLRPGRWR